MKKALYILLIAISAAATVSAAGRPTCAVVPFQAGNGFTEKQAAELNSRFRQALLESGEYDVMPTEEMMMKINLHLRKKPAAVTPYFVIVGRILKVDYIVTGTAEATTDALWLKTALCDVKKQTIKKRVKIFYRGDVSAFMKLAPQANLKRMLGKNGHPTEVGKQAAAKPVAEKKPDSGKTIASITPPDLKAAMVTLGDCMEDNVQVGLRLSYYMLLKDEKESFLGSINELKEDQDYAPHLFARFKLPLEPFWITIGYNKLRARTWTKAEPEFGEEGYTDGTIDLSGPFILLYFEKEQDEELTWFGEVGFAAYEADFVHDPEWHNAGYAGSHVMDFYDDYGLIFNGGCKFKVRENLDLSTYLSYTRVSVDMTYYLHGVERDSRVFPLSNVALGLGVQYNF